MKKNQVSTTPTGLHLWDSQYRERKECYEKHKKIDAPKNLFLHLGDIFISLSRKNGFWCLQLFDWI